MKLSPYLNELINSRITLNEKEAQIVEDFILSKSEPVKPSHLNHYKCLSASRNKVNLLGFDLVFLSISVPFYFYDL